jgi:hypothetical protein
MLARKWIALSIGLLADVPLVAQNRPRARETDRA